MPFIGNQPALSYTSFAKQDFTTSATTSYTLSQPVTNENEIALFINFVRQEPTTAYTASGTSLTLTSATSASDDMYAIFLGKAVQTVNPPAGSVGASQIADGSIALGKLSATGTKDSTTFLRGDNTFATAGGDNTPAFSAYLSSTQSLSHASITKIQFDTEHYDTDSAYDNSTNYRFTVPTGKGGKYLVTGQLFIEGNATSKANGVNAYLYLNGAEAMRCGIDFRANPGTNHSPSFATNMNLSAGDYLELYARWDSPDSSAASCFGSSSAQYRSHFGAIKIIT